MLHGKLLQQRQTILERLDEIMIGIDLCQTLLDFTQIRCLVPDNLPDNSTIRQMTVVIGHEELLLRFYWKVQVNRVLLGRRREG